jgi:hypothetical protein
VDAVEGAEEKLLEHESVLPTPAAPSLLACAGAICTADVGKTDGTEADGEDVHPADEDEPGGGR